jgi:hypothetical protein
MAISKGYDGAIYAGSSKAADSEIIHINNWEVNFSGDALENTAFGSATPYDRTYQSGLRAHTISFSGYSDPGDNSHSYLLDLQAAGTEAALVYFKAAYLRATSTHGSTGASGWDGKGVVTGLTISTPVDGLAAFSGTVQITGGLSTST